MILVVVASTAVKGAVRGICAPPATTAQYLLRCIPVVLDSIVPMALLVRSSARLGGIATGRGRNDCVVTLTFVLRELPVRRNAAPGSIVLKVPVLRPCVKQGSTATDQEPSETVPVVTTAPLPPPMKSLVMKVSGVRRAAPSPCPVS